MHAVIQVGRAVILLIIKESHTLLLSRQCVAIYMYIVPLHPRLPPHPHPQPPAVFPLPGTVATIPIEVLKVTRSTCL